MSPLGITAQPVYLPLTPQLAGWLIASQVAELAIELESLPPDIARVELRRFLAELRAARLKRWEEEWTV